MIGSKELQFVSNYANKVPYPGDDYQKNAILEFKKAFELYQKYFMGKQFSITMSDLSELNFEILPMNVSHMFGINSMMKNHYVIKNELLNAGLDNETISSYKFLKFIVDNLDDIVKIDKENGNIFLNYFRIKIKCSIFNKLSNFNEFNFGCINFDRNIYKYVNDEEFYSNATKLLFVSSDEAVCPYFIVGLKKNQLINSIDEETEEKESKINVENNIVETLFASSEPRKIFKLQRVTLPTSILIVDKNEYKETKASDEDMLHLRDLYAKDLLEYGSYLDVSAHYFAHVKDAKSKVLQR